MKIMNIFFIIKKSFDPTYFYNKNDILKNNNILNIIRKIRIKVLKLFQV